MTLQEYLEVEAQEGRFTGARLVDETTRVLGSIRKDRPVSELRTAVKDVLADFEHFDGEPVAATYLANLVDRHLRGRGK